MRDLHPLDPKERRTDGKAPNVPVRPGQAVDFLWTRAHVREAQGGCAGCGGRARGLGGEVVGLTVKEWLK